MGILEFMLKFVCLFCGSGCLPYFMSFAVFVVLVVMIWVCGAGCYVGLLICCGL